MVILIVEDEALIGLALRMVLNMAGYRVHGPVATSKHALDLAATEPPDLAFVDVNLSGGTEGFDIVRALNREHGTTCIFLTAWPELASKAKDVALGVIGKPYSPDAVLRAADYVAEVRTGARPASAPRGLALLN